MFEELTQKTEVALKDKQAELDHIQQVSQNRIDFLLEKMVAMEQKAKQVEDVLEYRKRVEEDIASGFEAKAQLSDLKI